MRRISLRTAAGNFTDVWPRSLAFRFGGAPEMRASATSIPSAEVPDIMPRTSMGFALMRFVFELRKEIQSVKGLQLVEVGAAEFFKNLAIQGREKRLLMAIVARGINRTRRESLAEFVFALFVFFQDFAGAFDDAAGKTGEAGNFGALTFVRPPPLPPPLQNNFA